MSYDGYGSLWRLILIFIARGNMIRVTVKAYAVGYSGKQDYLLDIIQHL